MEVSGAMDHKTHGLGHITDFESRIGSAKNKQSNKKSLFFINYWKLTLSTSIPQQKLLAELIKSVIKQEQLHKLQA